MMVILLYHDGTKPLCRHMTLYTFYTAECFVIIEKMAYFHSSIPLFRLIIDLFYLPTKCLIFPLAVRRCTNQSLVIGTH